MLVIKVNRSKLTQELVDAKIKCYVSAIDNTDVGADITFVDGTDMQLVQSIIDAHDPTPIAPAPSDKERIAELEQIINMILMGDM